MKHILLSTAAYLVLLGLATADETPSGLGLGDCDNSPSALSDFSGKDIPQTCFDVPLDTGTDTSLVKRCYYSYIPESCKGVGGPLPLVFDIHGLSGCPLNQMKYTGWMEKAEQECFAIVWPIGNTDEDRWAAPRCWNLPGGLEDKTYSDNKVNSCCCYEEFTVEGFLNPPVEMNDPLFLKMVVDSVVESQGKQEIAIDRSRVYMGGHSNGCMASMTMAALYSDIVAAVCCHAGTMRVPMAKDYSPVPIWLAIAKNDDTVSYDGTPDLDLGWFGGSHGVWAAESVFDYLANQNGCSSDVVVTSIADGEATIFARTENCTNDARVELLSLERSGHLPYKVPETSEYAPFAQVTVPTGLAFTDLDTTSLAWEFCSQHQNPYQKQLMDDGEEAEKEQMDGEGEPEKEPMDDETETEKEPMDDEGEEEKEPMDEEETQESASSAASFGRNGLWSALVGVVVGVFASVVSY